jgi:chorismate--pyruvate lyase
MTEHVLSLERIGKLNRDLRILVATNGTLTRILSVLANEEIVVEVVKQEIHDDTSRIAELKHLSIGRVLRRDILLKGRKSGIPYIAAESLVAVDLLPRQITTTLLETDRPIGEIMAASRIETFKEEARVWSGGSPDWLELDEYHKSRKGIIARRYRNMAEGKPVMIITEYFLRNVFEDAPSDELERRRRARELDTRSGDRFVFHDRIPSTP